MEIRLDLETSSLETNPIIKPVTTEIESPVKIGW